MFKKARYGVYTDIDGKILSISDDVFFINMAKELGFIPYCYPKIKCEHLILEKYKEDKDGNLVHQGFTDLL